MATGSPRCIGLTGGIGSGKSAALESFRRLGAAVMSSDEVVHRGYRDPDLIAAVRERFGPDVIDAAGAVDRAALGRIVFADEPARRDLERLVHPRIHAAREAWIAEQGRRDPPPPLLVCEVPLLYEVGLEDHFDAVLVVTASDHLRRARVHGRGQQFDGRSDGQLPEEEKIARADRIFVNDGSLDALDAWVRDRFAEYARP